MLPESNITIALSGIWGILLIASTIVWLMQVLQPKKNLTELIQRTKSWWIMIGIFTFALLTHRIVSYIFLGFISFLALKEYFSIIPTRRVDRSVLFWAYITIPIQFYLAGIAWYGMFIIFIPVYMFLFIPFRLVLSQQTEGFLKSVGTIQWGLMITVFALSHMAFLLALQNQGKSINTGAGLLLFLVFLTQFNDVAQYTAGKLFGKHKIIPLVSPKKTWEGFIGGLIVTTLFSVAIYPLLTPFTVWTAMAAGCIISIAGFIGDVTISAIKRDLVIKDTSSLIPGHGGILDRVDSLTFAAPLFFHLVYYLYY
ncbi:MAG: phosphatidate cytidylyltransferase [Gammaproteobacteria bacterium]|nr:phosphatidate cytidylyltransferase [Gammaproteobacteria bacterium]MCW5582449.1 phosphatidate cytidylyltransferase [Gammaproteobacteria bacterium]